MRIRLASWRALDWRQKKQLLGFALMLPMIDAALRRIGYTRTRRWLERHSMHPAPRQPEVHDLDQGQDLARLAAIAGRHGLAPATCLRQALALYWWLRRDGLQPQLKLGARATRDKALDAHAWIELDGHALGQTDLQHRPFEQ